MFHHSYALNTKKLVFCLMCLLLGTVVEAGAQENTPPAETEKIEPNAVPNDKASVELSDSPPINSPTEDQFAIASKDPALRHDLSPLSMFRNAHIVVQLVMISLIFASILTWTILLAKTISLGGARRSLAKDADTLQSAPTLEDTLNVPKRGLAAGLVAAAKDEWDLSSDLLDKDGVKERIASRLSRLKSHAAKDLNRGVGNLATIGATAPFVGLFGTVWGIMNSFISIAEAQSTNLAVVAPGIAEALLATALGLIAAIPAVMLYNHFMRQISGLKELMSDQTDAVMRLVSRDLDRAAMSSKRNEMSS